jgi:hypothetical protein
MGTHQLLLTILGSAAVAAIVSNVFMVIDRWRERVARERELLFKAAVDLSTASAARVVEFSGGGTPGLELMMVERTHEILRQVFETGKMSDENRSFLNNLGKKKDEGPKES